MFEKTINLDAFAHGQMASKLWLCEKMARYFPKPEGKLVFLGSWYGTLPFLLLARKQVQPSELVLVDLDRPALDIAKKILEYWVIEGLKISFVCKDALEIDFKDETLRDAQIVFNTSCEHMSGTKWFENIPSKTYFVVQGTNMIHEEHIFRFRSLANFDETFAASENLYFDKLSVDYATKSFERYMKIGRK